MRNSYIQQLRPQISINNFFYISGLIISLFLLLKYETYWVLPDVINDALKYGSCLLLGIHLTMTLPKYGKKLPLVLVLIAITLFVGLNIDRIHMMFVTAALVFGAKGLNFDNIVKWYFWIGLFFCVTTIIGNQIGLIKDHDVYIDALSSRLSFALSGRRLSFGYVWSTDFATHCFFILLAYWYIRKAELTLKEMLLFVFLAITILFYTDAKLGTGCILLLSIVTLFYRLTRNTQPKIYVVLIYSIPLFAILAIICTMMYQYSNFTWFFIDSVILAGRLRLGNEAIAMYGTPFWGQKLKMYGGETEGIYYNFIDSSFIQLIVIYGIAYTILIILAYTIITYKAYQRKDYVLILAVLMTGVSGLIAQHFLQICMNPFLITFIAKCNVNKVQSLKRKCKYEK